MKKKTAKIPHKTFKPIERFNSFREKIRDKKQYAGDILIYRSQIFICTLDGLYHLSYTHRRKFFYSIKKKSQWNTHLKKEACNLQSPNSLRAQARVRA